MNAIIFSVIGGVVMMFTGIITQQKKAIRNVAIIALIILLLANIFDTYGILSIHIGTHGMLNFQKFGLYFNTLAYAATLLFILISGADVTQIGEGKHAAEFFALIFFSLSGIAIITSYNSLLLLFLGIEIMSIPLYILTGGDKRNLKSNEASLKYFLMGSFSTGILLMGIALMYGAHGGFEISAMKPSAVSNEYGILDPLGLVLVFIAIAFKVSAAPFHFWTPDVYDGSPSVFTSFMATIIKAAGFIAFIRLFDNKYVELGLSWRIILPLVIIATLLVGNITAIFQQSVKRMMAYSSIAQAGFMLFAVFAENDMAKEGILIYTVAYSVATIGIFAVLEKMEDISLAGYNGLAKKHPLLAATNTIFLLSLTGIPLTAGFFAKYYMLLSVIKYGGSTVTWLVIVAVIFAAISAYYYFRVIQAMYFKTGNPEVRSYNKGFCFMLVILAAITILIGIFPTIILNWFYF
ncbi:NADH-quinone oxidoreductase subunit N [Hydrotalea sandarakina]|jgi:NADH-quinone oxidoreductase subunit N|uniref:NADH-quinone oxidoreductase subunit N n=1 Tax=Hydrotalea sandarakina TaxID=1004304 RepID=A0A2W7S0I2_9BACT|nr:NADH-quinone oxidoreductase subunit N [Hydrotalea sandarakina]PZX64526.1 NADH-quinone oxidoreductase subunit N [Hydrotalea sandarakina]